MWGTAENIKAGSMDSEPGTDFYWERICGEAVRLEKGVVTEF
jgi:hypothetical protein